MGERRVRGWSRPLDAMTVVLVVAIGVGVMHDIGLALRLATVEWLGIFVLTTLLNVGSLVLGVLVFWSFGRGEAFAAGLCASIKNMAVMVAAVLGTVDPRIALVVVELPGLRTPRIDMQECSASTTTAAPAVANSDSMRSATV